MTIINRNRSAEKSVAKGDQARNIREWGVAAEHYTKYLELKPDNAAIWVQLGHCRKELGNIADAAKAYLRALSIEPESADTHVQMGHIEKLSRNFDQSLAWYKKALALDPSFEPAQREVAGAEASQTARTGDRSSSSAATGKEAGAELEALVSRVVERRMAKLSDQTQSVRAIAVELQRLGKTADALSEQLAEATSQIASLERNLEQAKQRQSIRLDALEATAPLGQHSFPALLARLADVSAQRADLNRFAEQLENLSRRLNGHGGHAAKD